MPSSSRRIGACPALTRPGHADGGAFFAGVVAVFGSLWQTIVLHALIDLGSGAMAWLALRDETELAPADAA